MENCINCERLFTPDPRKAKMRDKVWPGMGLRYPECSRKRWRDFAIKYGLPIGKKPGKDQ